MQECCLALLRLLWVRKAEVRDGQARKEIIMLVCKPWRARTISSSHDFSMLPAGRLETFPINKYHV